MHCRMIMEVGRELAAVERGGKEFTGVTPNAANHRMYAAVDGER